MALIKASCVVYRGYAKFRHRHAPETLASVDEFVAHRTTETDRCAMTHRYDLIAANDPRSVARRTSIPVHYLGGLVDPLVPWPFVRRWLRRNCPGYRGGRTMWRADHNVLGTDPEVSARQVLEWMSAGNRGTADRR
jgi:pimeloyl-ACP methyl ester carboxylesterase